MVRPVARTCSQCGDAFNGGDAVSYPPLCHNCRTRSEVQYLPPREQSFVPLLDAHKREQVLVKRLREEQQTLAEIEAAARQHGYDPDSVLLAMDSSVGPKATLRELRAALAELRRVRGG